MEIKGRLRALGLGLAIGSVASANPTALKPFEMQCVDFQDGSSATIRGNLLSHRVEVNSEKAPYHILEYTPFDREELIVADAKCLRGRYRSFDKKDENCQDVRVYSYRSFYCTSSFNAVKLTPAEVKITQTCAAGSRITEATSLDRAKRLFELVLKPVEGTLADGTKVNAVTDDTRVSHPDCASFEE